MTIYKVNFMSYSGLHKSPASVCLSADDCEEAVENAIDTVLTQIAVDVLEITGVQVISARGGIA